MTSRKRNQIKKFIIVLLLICTYFSEIQAKNFFSHFGFTSNKKTETRVHKVFANIELREDSMLTHIELDITIGSNQKILTWLEGDLSLVKWEKEDHVDLKFNPKSKAYELTFEREGDYQVKGTFLCKSNQVKNELWKEGSIKLPEADERIVRVQKLKEHNNIELQGVFRVEDKLEKGITFIQGVLKPNEALNVKWKSGTKVKDAALVISSDVNTIINIEHGAFALDSLYQFEIAQGEMSEIEFVMPQGIQITGVKGEYIRDWNINEKEEKLTILLNKKQIKEYSVQIISEQSFGDLPKTVRLLNIEPMNCIRSSGSLLIGGDHAIQASLRESLGLVQVNTKSYSPKVNKAFNRKVPLKKAYGFKHSSSKYVLSLALKKIIPIFDVSHQQEIKLLENNILISNAMELNIKEAALKILKIKLPESFSLSNIEGPGIKEENVHILNSEDKSIKEIVVNLNKELIGKALINIEIESGINPLDKEFVLKNIEIEGVRSSRGTIKLTVEKGLDFKVIEKEYLREISVGSTMGRTSHIEKAFRYKDKAWKFVIKSQKKKSGLHAETFHLMTVNQQILYGSVAVSYFINDAPVQTLSFKCPEYFDNIEFVGGDIRRWQKRGDIWEVQLNRKIIGDYNLAIIYHHKVKSVTDLNIDNVTCINAETQSGYVVLTSHEGVNIEGDETSRKGMIGIARDEIPEHYQLLIGSPIIDSYKHIGKPEAIPKKLNYYKSSKLLPALIELADIKTEILPSKSENTEIRTKIIYKIINTDEQFVNISLPEGAKIWSTRIKSKEEDKFKKTISTLEGHMLKVPLPRNPNPNEPATLEVEYGQTLAALDFFGEMTLQAPRGDLKSAFSRWELSVPDAWGVQKSEKFSMNRVSPTMTFQFIKSSFYHHLGGLKKIFNNYTNILGGYFVMMMGLMVLTICLRKYWWKRVLSFAILGLLVFWGFVSNSDGMIIPDSIEESLNKNNLIVNDTIQLLSNDDANIVLNVVPLWVSYLFSVEVISLLAASIIVFMLSRIFISLSGLFIAISISFLISAILSVPDSWEVVFVFFTLGVPGIILLALMYSFIKDIQFSKVMNRRLASSLVLLVLPIFEITNYSEVHAKKIEKKEIQDIKNNEISKGIKIVDLSTAITIEDDAVNLKQKFSIVAENEGEIYIPSKGYILINPKLSDADNNDRNLIVKSNNEKLWLEIKRKGEYEINLEMISSLPIKGNNLSGSLNLNTPLALKNEFSLSIPSVNMKVSVEDAILSQKEEIKSDGKDYTFVKSTLKPKQNIVVSWEPRSRERGQEEAKIFSESISLVNFERGLIQSEHIMKLTIPQGTIRDIVVSVPKTDAVTGVIGKYISSWHYDPMLSVLKIAMSRDISDNYQMRVVCESPMQVMPYEYVFHSLNVNNSLGHKAIVGFSTGKTVTLSSDQNSQRIDLDSFLRESSTYFSDLNDNIDSNSNSIQSAFGFQKKDIGITAKVEEKLTEIRSKEIANFNISDERLVYIGTLVLNISKAGQFSFDISFPKDYEIDNLVNKEMSHWEEIVKEDHKICRIYLNEWLLGESIVSLVLSKNLVELPDNIKVPHVEVKSTLKHTGELTLTSDQGIRLNIDKRVGLSELKTKRSFENNTPQAFMKKYRLLQKDWSLEVNPELIKPRMNAEALLVNTVHEGIVKHKNFVHLNLFNAGVKELFLELPSDALAVVIKGPSIAQIIRENEGLWKIKLEEKWFGKPYPIEVVYETRFDHQEGLIAIKPFSIKNVDLWNATSAILSKGHLELKESGDFENYQKANARNIPSKFGAGDLSSSVFCYTTNSKDIVMNYEAHKLVAAKLLDAKVVKADIKTVVSRSFSQIHKVDMKLNVGNKRFLELIIPKDSYLWKLQVSGKSVIPTTQSRFNERILMIPLPHIAVSEDSEIDLQFVYETEFVKNSKLGKLELEGPRLDLPLQNINWTVYTPNSFLIADTKGSLSPLFSQYDELRQHKYSTELYKDILVKSNLEALDNAIKLQSKGQWYAQNGQQLQARQALESSYNYSFVDKNFNDDARVQLHRLAEQQTLVGLHGTRAQLRSRSTGGGSSSKNLIGQEWGNSYSLQDVERLNSALDRHDSENLELIAKRIVALQASSSMSPAQLEIQMPIQGNELKYHRPLLVDPFSELKIELNISNIDKGMPSSWLFSLLLAFIIFILFKSFTVLTERK